MRTSCFKLTIAALFALACNRDNSYTGFDDTSEDAKKAIATDLDFRLDENIFLRWERAQTNLEKLPAGELDKTPDPGGADPVARGTNRLESNPRAKRAIESAGLSVKQFVLATIALAQAMKASKAAVPPTIGAIAENVRFVMDHSSRLSNRGAASIWVPPSELSEEELADQRAMQRDSAANSEIATGAEQAVPTVPPLEDWSQKQKQPPPPPQPRPRDNVRVLPPTEPPPKDSVTPHAP